MDSDQAGNPEVPAPAEAVPVPVPAPPSVPGQAASVAYVTAPYAAVASVPPATVVAVGPPPALVPAPVPAPGPNSSATYQPSEVQRQTTTPPAPRINVLQNTPPTDYVISDDQPPPIPPRPQQEHPLFIRTARPSASNSNATIPRPQSVQDPIRRYSHSPSPAHGSMRGDDVHSNHTVPGSASRPITFVASPERPNSGGSNGVSNFSPPPAMLGAYDPPPGPPPAAVTRETSVYYAPNGMPRPTRGTSRHPSANGNVGVSLEAVRSGTSFLDHTVPVIAENASSEPPGERNIEHRLQPTLESAQRELRKYQLQARATGWSLNFAIGIQVVLGALTTGVAAATSGHAASVATSVLGGMSTLAASYLAKARGSGEPEASNLMVKDLESFVRDCQSCILDKGYLVGNEFDDLVQDFRNRFEQILGNRPKSMSDRLKDRFMTV